MDKGLGRWWPVPIALAAGFVLGGATAKDSSLFGQTVAAWVQAIGAMIAIWFAGRFTHRDRLKAAADRMDALYGLAAVATDLVASAVRAMDEASCGDGARLAVFPSANFHDVDGLLAQVPVMELGSTKAPDVVLKLRNDVRLVQNYLINFSLDVAGGGDLLKAARSVEVDAENQRAAIEKWRDGRWRDADRWWT